MKEAKEREALIESMTIYHKDNTLKARWKRYRANAWRVTRGQDLSVLQGIEKRSFEGYHVDHIVSIWDGWKNGISYQQIGHISNLRVIDARLNLKKNRKSDPEQLRSLLSATGDRRG